MSAANRRAEQTPITATTDRVTYSVEEVARVLGIGRNTAYEAVRTGKIPALRIGRRYLIPVDALQRLLSEA